MGRNRNMNRNKVFIRVIKIMLILLSTAMASSSSKVYPSLNFKTRTEKHAVVSLLNLFSNCTIHFVGSKPEPDPNPTPPSLRNQAIPQFQSISRLIIDTGFITVSSVSEYFPKPTTNTSFYMGFQKVHRNSTPFRNFDEKSSDYKTLMRFSKHVSTCLLQIPIFKNPVDELFQYLRELNFLSLQPCCPPDYILIVENKEILQKSNLLIPSCFSSWYIPPLSILLAVDVDESDQNVFLANGLQLCTTYNKLFGLNEFRISGRILLNFNTFQLNSLQTLREVWKQELLLRNQFPFYKPGSIDSTCESLMKPSLIRNKPTASPVFWIDACLNSLIYTGNLSRPISTKKKYGTVIDTEVDPTKNQYFEGKPRIIQNSCEFHGFRYVILLDWNKVKESSNFFHGNSLLQPFSLRMWMLVIFTTLLVSLTLFVSRTSDALFFTMATLLEQGDDGSRKKSRKNFLVIILWFFVAYLIRISYTSSIYSYMTAEEAPKVPSSFRKVVSQNEYPIVGDYHEMSMLVPRASAESKHYNYLNELQGGRIICLNLLRNYGSEILWNDNLTQSQMNAYAREQSVSVKRMYFLNVSNPIFGVIGVSPKEMMSLNEFSYLYSDLPISGLLSTGFSEIYAVVAFGGRRLVWNNEPPFLNVLMGYKGAYDLNGKMTDEIFGRLMHSGLWSYWKKMYKFVNVAKNLRKISEEVLRLEKSWDFVNLAKVLVSDMTSMKNGLKIGHSLDAGMMQVEVLSVVWIMHAGMCNICILVFLLEIFGKYCTIINIFKLK
ncbi:unnamed protein product [Orchesella dallaii]|uniref:Uncharacterized protein n=1 Tax=Orchesella dallaii TaxID=48710 RepID=A0ABP1QMZ7_9HEXA